MRLITQLYGCQVHKHNALSFENENIKNENINLTKMIL